MTGLSDAVLTRARFRLSMGPMTFPHQFMPLLLLEQSKRSATARAQNNFTGITLCRLAQAAFEYRCCEPRSANSFPHL